MRSISWIAASILSPLMNLDGLASAALIAICDFLICNSILLPSGLTNPLLSVFIILTVKVSFTFLSWNHSNGSG